MTSTSTLAERLRRASQSAEPIRDVAVIMSEFIGEGGVEPVDDPFHPARKNAVEGLVAPLESTDGISVILIRSAPGVVAVPQRHEVPVVVGVLTGRVVVDIYLEDQDDRTLTHAGGVAILPDEVYVIEPDVVHNIGFVGEEAGLALHVILGDLTAIERSRWIDGRHERLAPTAAYPLTALPMPLAPSDDEEDPDRRTDDGQSSSNRAQAD
jgi:predicted metal-dependent enzyme (double-stranded beta helix superfamily)